MILKEEQEKNIKIIVELCKESGMKLEKVLQKLQEKCDLTREEAEINLEKYW